MAKRKKKNKTFEYIITIILVIIVLYNNFNASKGEETGNYGTLEVQFIDVGQADAILIKGETENLLIDAGNNEDGPKLVTYLQEQNITKLDYVVGTHAHEDHIGGLDDIIYAFDIKHFYMPDAITTTKTFEDVLDALETKNLAFETPNIGDTFTIDKSNIEVLYIGNDETDLNSTSIVLRLDHGNNSFLFTGDMTSEEEKKIEDNSKINVDVLKVAHHGSKYSSTNSFINKVSPEYAIIEVGKDNTYDHPSKRVLNLFKKIDVNVYRTDEDGTIIIKSDGNNLDIETIKTDTNGNKE